MFWGPRSTTRVWTNTWIYRIMLHPDGRNRTYLPLSMPRLAPALTGPTIEKPSTRHKTCPTSRRRPFVPLGPFPRLHAPESPHSSHDTDLEKPAASYPTSCVCPYSDLSRTTGLPPSPSLHLFPVSGNPRTNLIPPKLFLWNPPPCTSGLLLAPRSKHCSQLQSGKHGWSGSTTLPTWP